MVAYSFKLQFAEDVESGKKKQTIRADRKRHARPGEAVQLYTGMRTKKCRKLVDPDPICTAVRDIEIASIYDFADVRVAGVNLVGAERLTAFALADGFDSIDEFVAFFKKEHGLPFRGVLVEWEPNHA
ncbi:MULTISPECIES: hypothetical protein [unclassified Maridesulfovibrio]|uniref:hypothetical protein n=1 Tax=unclassified Maridesulfovibrio TaxID=2794999 RepID=UPI003B41DF36